jgi:D-tyrosyl-tRNA(Tyr) deacylase
MKALIQRVKKASVSIGGENFSAIGKGLLIFLGVGIGDTEKEIEYLVRKIVNLRIFEDQSGKLNYSIKDIGGEILIVSQFTLYADCKKGNRPSFEKAEKPDVALKLYEKFINRVKTEGIEVKTGVFGASMEVELINDGPVTIMLESLSGN